MSCVESILPPGGVGIGQFVQSGARSGQLDQLSALKGQPVHQINSIKIKLNVKVMKLPGQSH